jgi:hypothetical protein
VHYILLKEFLYIVSFDSVVVELLIRQNSHYSNYICSDTVIDYLIIINKEMCRNLLILTSQFVGY